MEKKKYKGIRLESQVMDKVKFLAEANDRTVPSMLAFIVKDWIRGKDEKAATVAFALAPAKKAVKAQPGGMWNGGFDLMDNNDSTGESGMLDRPTPNYAGGGGMLDRPTPGIYKRNSELAAEEPKEDEEESVGGF